jgi:hypothetical protein
MRRFFVGAVLLAWSCAPVAAAADPSGLVFDPVEETLRAPLSMHRGTRRDLDNKRALPAAPQAAVQPPLTSAATQTVLAEGFEGVFPSGSWTAFDNNGSTNGEVYWDDTNFRSYAGSWSGGCADGGANASAPGTPYSNGMDSWMVYGPISLSDANAATLSFRYWLDSESGFDYFKYMVSTNGTNFSGFQTSGNSGGWVSGSLDLTNVPNLGNVTGQPNVWIAFAFTSDTSLTAEGVYVDEVLLQKTVGGGPDIRIDPLTLNFTQQARRPIFVELDWMEDGTHSHKPSQAVIDRIVQTFANAGYSITIDVSNAIPHQSTVPITNSPSGSASVQSLMSQYFNHAGDSRYYYSIWGHNYSYNGGFTTSSGIADLPGRVHLVTLGSFSGQTGTFSNQVGTFIHEFGHNLGQQHGGADGDNYKPNYLSVMNYHYQLSGLGPSLQALGFANSAAGFDDFSYSHGLLPSLNESNLDESFGIGLGRSVDWNCSGTIQTGVAKDIQDANFCSAFGSLSVISDFDNWTNLSSQIRTLRSSTEPPRTPSVLCITPEENRPLQERIDQLRAAGELPPDGPGPELPFLTAGDAGRSFLIFNDGGSPLTVSSMSLDTATSWIHWAPQAPFTIAPGKSQEVLVFVDFAQAPAGQTTRRLLVQSNDPDESPYPGGVNLVISALGTSTPADTALINGAGVNGSLTSSSSQSSWRYYFLDLPAGSTNLVVDLFNLTADADLYVLRNGKPTLSTYQCRPFVDGTASEQCSFPAPASGRWWVGVNNFATGTINYTVRATWSAPNPSLKFYTVTPCRVFDTRTSSALVSGVPRNFTIAGTCGIPVTAKAVSVNFTVTGPTANGEVNLWPADLGNPATNVLSFRAGVTRANNGILELATDGGGGVTAQAALSSGGTVHLILDVNGYFQ